VQSLNVDLHVRQFVNAVRVALLDAPIADAAPDFVEKIDGVGVAVVARDRRWP
jgi:hypothetical protein